MFHGKHQLTKPTLNTRDLQMQSHEKHNIFGMPAFS